MRACVGAFVLALASACAVGSSGSGVTSFGVSSAAATSGGSSGSGAATTLESAEDPTGSVGGTGTTGGPGTTSLDGTDTGPGTSGDSGAVDDCDVALETFAADPGWSAAGVPD